MHPDLVGFLAGWLADRSSQVVLGGAASPAKLLADSVFQGTVLGPLFWIVCFADVRRALVHKRFQETVFADDLKAWRAFRLVMVVAEPHEAPLSTLRDALARALRINYCLILAKSLSIFCTGPAGTERASKCLAASSTLSCVCLRQQGISLKRPDGGSRRSCEAGSFSQVPSISGKLNA